jgi:hypothetical protein
LLRETSFDDAEPSSPRAAPFLSNRANSLDTASSTSPLALPLQFDSDEDTDETMGAEAIFLNLNFETMGAEAIFLNLNFEDDEVDLRLTGQGLADRATTAGGTRTRTAVVNPKARLNSLLKPSLSFAHEPDVLEQQPAPNSPNRAENSKHTPSRVNPLTTTANAKPPWQRTSSRSSSVRDRRRNSVTMAVTSPAAESAVPNIRPIHAFQPPAATDLRPAAVIQALSPPTLPEASSSPESLDTPIRLSVTEDDKVQLTRTYSAHRRHLASLVEGGVVASHSHFRASACQPQKDNKVQLTRTYDALRASASNTRESAHRDSTHPTGVTGMSTTALLSTAAPAPYTARRSASLQPRTLTATQSPLEYPGNWTTDAHSPELSAIAASSVLADIDFRKPLGSAMDTMPHLTGSQVSFQQVEEHTAMHVDDITPLTLPHSDPMPLRLAVAGSLLLALVLVVTGCALVGTNTGGNAPAVVCIVLGVLLALTALGLGWYAQQPAQTSLPKRLGMSHDRQGSVIDWSQLDTFDI